MTTVETSSFAEALHVFSRRGGYVVSDKKTNID